MSEDHVSRRQFLELTGAGAIALTAGAGTASAEPSELQSQAKAHVAAQTDAEVGDLVVDNESVVSFGASGESYYDAKLFDTENNDSHRVALDANGDVVDLGAAAERDREAYQKQYGNLTPELDKTVRTADPDEQIDIAVWVTIDRTAAEQAVESQGYATEDERRDLLSEERKRRATAQATALESALDGMAGVEVTEVGKYVPRVGAKATPEAVQRIETIEGVWGIFERDPRNGGDGLGSASLTHGSYSQRNGDYDATGEKVGVFEWSGIPDTNNINRAKVYGSPSTTDHGNVTANCAASIDDDKPGMASEASVYTAAEPYNSFDTKLGWFADQGVSAVNCSFYWYDSDTYINSEDVTIGQFIYDHYLPVVTISGNYDSSNYANYNVATPGRGFNTITVGAIEDKNTGSDLTDDEIWHNSCYKDPTTQNGDLHKPEVAAVGNNINTAGGYTGWYGTSFAAPHVSGLVTLLSKFAGSGDPTPNGYPEYAKAVTLASAGHDASTFDKEGVGTIQAPSAESIVKNGQYVTDTFSQSNGAQSYTTSLDSANSEVRVALAWLTNPQTNNLVDNASAHPDVDLDLYVYDPYDSRIDYSVSYDSGWEYVTFDPSYTGTYTFEVNKANWEDSDDSAREMALAWHVE